MPRKNNRPKHQPYKPSFTQSNTKKRYPTKRAAEEAAQNIMLMNMNVSISVYKEIDGGWYLTSRKSD